MGLKGDLTAGEIVEQLVHARRVTAIKNVVYMVSYIPLNHHSTTSCATSAGQHLPQESLSRRKLAKHNGAWPACQLCTEQLVNNLM